MSVDNHKHHRLPYNKVCQDTGREIHGGSVCLWESDKAERPNQTFNQWVGVEIIHRLSSHHKDDDDDDDGYLHQRNEDSTEVAWCVWMNGILQRLLVGCEVVTRTFCKRFSDPETEDGFKLQTHRPCRRRSWLVFPRCSWWPGSQLEHAHQCLLPVNGVKGLKN